MPRRRALHERRRWNRRGSRFDLNPLMVVPLGRDYRGLIVDQMNFMPPTRPEPAWVAFSGERSDFERLIIRGALLEVVTAGFYRFWLATDMRRHLWSHTSVASDALEYTGRAKELFIGFLFAMAILMPIYVAYFLIGLEAERAKAFASLPLFLFFYLFGQFAIYRARRYRLTRTVWRGARFSMDGSGWAYAVRAALWSVPTILTLGLVLPWREAALERYKMRHCHYGDLSGSFEGRGWDFFKRGWWLWLIAMALIVAITTLLANSPHEVQHQGARTVVKWHNATASFLSLVLLLALPFLYGFFKAVEWRWWVAGVCFGQVQFQSALPMRAFIGLYWKVIGWGLLLAAAVGVFVGGTVAIVAYITQAPMMSLLGPGVHSGLAVLIPAVLGYLLFILAINAVLRINLQRDVWARVAESTVVYYLDTAEDVASTGDLASALGEGFADGLDVVGF